jgi:hypothetical protein
MANFFKYFPTTIYSLDTENSSLDIITNLTFKFKFNDTFKENSVVYYDYIVPDGETPETLADKFYNSSEKHWIILILNNIVNPLFDWPMSYTNLNKYINSKYSANNYADTANTSIDGLTWAQSNTKEYFVNERKTILTTGEYSEELTILTSADYANTSALTSNNYTLGDGTQIEIKRTRGTKKYYEYEIENNENKRRIKLLKTEFVPLLEKEFKELKRR